MSILLPCYNAERFVAQALDSLLGQTHSRLEVLALDDGSTDSTSEILQSFAAKDQRVVYIRAATNHGLVTTLNHGVKAARGEFIARMDADDFAAPDRIAKQLAFLTHRPDVSVVGTASRWIAAEDGRTLRPRPVRCVEPAGARFMGLFATPVSHPTILARAEVMRAHPYGIGSASLHTEDYEMFARMLFHGVNFANLPEPLLTARVDPRGVSLRYEAVQIEHFVMSSREHLERETGHSPDRGAHRVLVNRIDASVTPDDLAQGLELLADLEIRAIGAAGSDSDAAVADIRRVADMQRVDIFVQGAARGTAAVRAAAARLASRHLRLLRSHAARTYILSKATPRRMWDTLSP